MRLRLILKITIFTNLVIIMVTGLFAYLNAKNLEAALLRGVITEVDRLSETIIRSSHHQMLEADLPRVHQTISEIGTQKDIKVIRLINKSGEVRVSTRKDELGLILDKKAEACNMCHSDNGEPRTHASSMNSSRVFLDRKGDKVLGMAKAIYNEESCFTASCHFHPSNTRILGVLDVVVSLVPMSTLVDEYRNKIIALTICLLVVISISLTLLAQKFINYPISLLVEHTGKLAAGDLDQKVVIDSRDEFGDLADSFNNMTENLKIAREELESWGKKLELKVEERAAQIESMQRHLMRSERLASIGELVAGIAHELNNPLTSVLIFSSLVRKDARLHPDLTKDIEMIIQETERSAKIVKGLLNFSRESMPEQQPVSLNSLIETTLTLVGNQTFFHDIAVCRKMEENLPPALVDPGQIEQVLINILINASQSMTSGGVLTISTGMTVDGNGVFVSISDTGCGIPEENLHRIFDPFFSTKEKGTGLGLSLCYGIIDNNGGRIDVESEVGIGSTFTIHFPVPTDDGSIDQEPLPVEVPGGSTSDSLITT